MTDLDLPNAVATPPRSGADSGRRERPWRRLLSLYSSSVGRKYVMALSGIAIVGFVVVHLIGTLKIFLGPDATNFYGEALRDLGGHLAPRTHLLWIFRIGLLAAFGVHLHAAFSLDRRNRKARGAVRPSVRDHRVSTYASRTMLHSGVVVALFIVFHLADLTWGATNPGFEPGNAYANQIASFTNPAIVGVYLLGVGTMTLHLFHGLWSLFQSMGARTASLDETSHRRLAALVATGIGIGYASIPLAVLAGLLTSGGFLAG